ncbi:MAG: ribonuclease R [Flavobacteriales bacterium]|nr:ribonuclease R [Flavobacteriales bacterium]
MGRKGRNSPQKNTQTSLLEQVLAVFKKSPTKVFNHKQVAAAIGSSDPEIREKIISILDALEEKNLIQKQKRGSFQLKKGPAYLEGTIQITLSGSAFVISPESKEDIYIRPRYVGTALNGDQVKVYLFAKRKGNRPEGEVVEVVKRAREKYVGTIHINKKMAYLEVDDLKMQLDIMIPVDELKGAEDGQKAVARITDWPDAGLNPMGEITEVLGYAGDKIVERHSILLEFGFPTSFPEEVENEANRIPEEITEEDLKTRRDFRDVTTFTIDPFDAKDFDDALSIRSLEDGTWEIGVHIADVSHYVRPGSALDTEAYERGTSVYLADTVVPMLPERLSNGICSLRPKEEKLCFSAVFLMNEAGKLTNRWLGRTVIYSDHRFTYETAQAILEGEEGPFAKELRQLDKLAKLLRKERFEKGAIAFETIETRFRFDDAGNPVEVYLKESKDSNHLIEEFMLLANRQVAEYAGKELRRPFVYRTHDSPRQEKLDVFSNFIERFGHKINTRSKKELSGSLNKLMEDIKGTNEENIIEQLSIRTMEKAVYTTENIGHYGLAFAHYSHFTSPIRRYPDIMVHRLLERYLSDKPSPKGEDLESRCKHASEMERKAVSAERASIKYMQVQFLADKVGNTYEGIISGVTEWGLYVEILENKCEGMVRLRDIDDDYYVFEEENFRVVGQRTGKNYQLGDKVAIIIKKADLVRKQLDFGLISEAF